MLMWVVHGLYGEFKPSGPTPTPLFLPGESHGWRSLEGYIPWGHKELDMTERLTNTHTQPGDICLELCVRIFKKKTILVDGFAWVLIYCVASLSSREDRKASFRRMVSEMEALEPRPCPVLQPCARGFHVCCWEPGFVAVVLSAFHASLKGLVWCVSSGAIY